MFAFIIGHFTAFAQKHKFFVSTQIRQITLNRNIDNVSYNLISDSFPLFQLSIIYPTQNKDSIKYFRGHTYWNNLIGPGVNYFSDHSISASNNYVVLMDPSQYKRNHFNKGTPIYGFDTLSDKIITRELPADTLINQWITEYTYRLNFNGIRDGLSVENTRSGKIVTSYGFGYLQGYKRSYDLKGNLLWEACYHEDRANGPENIYYPCNDSAIGCGKLKQSSFYHEAERAGEWKYFSNIGKLTKTEQYNENKLDGEVTTYYENGGIDSMRNYKNGELLGECVKWSPDGKIIEDKHYLYGSLFGKYRSWYTNGNKKEEGEYEEGEKVKLWKTWNEKGKLTSSRYYKKRRAQCTLPGVSIDDGVYQGVFEPGYNWSHDMNVFNFTEDEISRLYERWIYSKPGKPLLKYKGTVKFRIKIDENEKITWEIITALNEKQTQALQEFLNSLPNNKRASQISGFNFASETIYEVGLVRAVKRHFR